jgi:exodeoxyribonuclease X
MITLRVIDIETTGMSPGDGAEVVEVGWQDVLVPDTSHPALLGRPYSLLYSPTRPMPPEVRAVHHIYPVNLVGKPVYAESPLTILDIEGPVVMVAHNTEFEQQFLSFPGHDWLCTYKSALRVWPDAPHHGNQSLMYWRGLETEMEWDLRMPPHRAAPDAYVTAHILLDLLHHATIEQMIDWTREPRLLPTCPIGRDWKGKAWPQVELSFLHWMMRQPDMEADYKWNAQREIDRRRTERLRGD